MMLVPTVYHVSVQVKSKTTGETLRKLGGFFPTLKEAKTNYKKNIKHCSVWINDDGSSFKIIAYIAIYKLDKLY